MKLLSGIVELKPNWFVRLPRPMTEMEMSHWRFDPVTLTVIATGVQAYGQYRQGEAAKAEGKAQQQQAEYNASLKDRQAKLELARAEAEASQFTKEGEVLQATQRVGYAKGGVLTVGTPAEVLEQTAQELDADRMSILREGYLAESFRLSEAENLRFEGRIARARGRNIATGFRYAAIGTILTGFGRALEMSSAGKAAKESSSGSVRTRPVTSSDYMSGRAQYPKRSYTPGQ